MPQKTQYEYTPETVEDEAEFQGRSQAKRARHQTGSNDKRKSEILTVEASTEDCPSRVVYTRQCGTAKTGASFRSVLDRNQAHFLWKFCNTETRARNEETPLYRIGTSETDRTTITAAIPCQAQGKEAYEASELHLNRIFGARSSSQDLGRSRISMDQEHRLR